MAAGLILQFGTSRFLQAHVDLFASEAREIGQPVPDVVVVQTTRNLERRRRLDGFSDPAGFPVILRGMKDGAPYERSVQVLSVREGLSAAAEWPKLARLFVEEATFVVSNTGDAGYEIPAVDRGPRVESQIPVSFCGMLGELLYRRWRAGRPGLTFLPCELVTRNGNTLHDRIVELAISQRRQASFVDWLTQECVWANTLVDRIVSAPLEPAGAVAEPYALWAIEAQPGLVLPFVHPCLVVTNDLEPYERLKLHILNLGHTWLAARWHARGAASDATVRAAMGDADTRAALERVMAEEVVPGFAARGLGDAAYDYVATTLPRFENPFLDHRIADIFAGHWAKIDKRVGAFLRWVDAGGDAPPMPELRALAALGEA